MSSLILVKHALPEIETEVPARDWRLSEQGRRRCRDLAARLAPYDPAVVITSDEPKAIETGEIVAARLSKPLEIVAGLHEHDRSNTPFSDKEVFETAVAGFFAHPQSLVMGKETAEEAHQRFSEALRLVREKYPGQTIMVVTHGTVITLFISRLTGYAPFPLWQRLGLPAFVVLSRPDLRLEEIVEEI
ncbi:MAG: histidine phosphatase family protein [Chloroflexi bacterium]|nr:histidine phosphatase family protein [Chloroflexota bacterium]